MPEKRDPWAGHTVLMPVPERAPFEPAQVRTQAFARAQAAAPSTPKEPAANAGRADDFGSVTVLAPAPSLAVITAFSGSALHPPQVAPRPNPDSATDAVAVAPQAAAIPLAPRRALGAMLVGIRARVEDEFRRTPRGMRWALFALPVVAWAALGFGHEAETPSAKVARIATLEPANITATSPPRPAGAPAAGQPAEQPVNPGILAGKRTLQARAADAAARGAFNEAIPLYEELARLNPTHAEFAAAARILRAKRGAP